MEFGSTRGLDYVSWPTLCPPDWFFNSETSFCSKRPPHVNDAALDFAFSMEVSRLMNILLFISHLCTETMLN